MSKFRPIVERHQHPSESIGHELAERRGKTTKVGTAIRYQYTGSTIRNMKTNEEWPGFRFLMRGKRGSEWWSVTYPDKSGIAIKTLPELRNALQAINSSKAHAASWAGELEPYIKLVEQLIAEDEP